MKQFTKTIFLVLAFLLILSCAQRGGSRSKSSSSGSSYQSSHRSYGSSRYNSNGNCTTVDGVTTCTYQEGGNCTTVDGVTTCTYQEAESSWSVILVVVGIFAVIVILAVREGNKAEERRKTVIASVMK
jgi:hypothetical protein